MKQTTNDLMLKSMNAVHGGMLKVSGGRIWSTVASLPVVELHTTGRTSGKPRKTILLSPLQEGGSYIIVASKNGDDRNPDWFGNLVANPEIKLVVDGEVLEVVARVASAEEKTELWPRIVSAYKSYAGYQNKTDRDIPVVICEPRTGSMADGQRPADASSS